MTDNLNLIMEVRLLKTFELYFSNCMRRDHETLLEHDQKDKTNTESETLRPSNVSCRIQELVNRKMKHLVRCSESIVTPNLSDIKRELTKFHQNIKLLLRQTSRNCLSATSWMATPWGSLDWLWISLIPFQRI